MYSVCPANCVVCGCLQSVLTTTLAVTDMRLEADYSVTFPGSGEAPAETRAGTVTEKVSRPPHVLDTHYQSEILYRIRLLKSCILKMNVVSISLTIVKFI